MIFYSVNKCRLWVYVLWRALCVGLLAWGAPTEIITVVTFIISFCYRESMTMIGHRIFYDNSDYGWSLDFNELIIDIYRGFLYILNL